MLKMLKIFIDFKKIPLIKKNYERKIFKNVENFHRFFNFPLIKKIYGKKMFEKSQIF
jgi:hypothetical protein